MLEWVSPGQHVFVPNAPQRDTFMNIVICSWAVLGVGALILMVLYYPSKPRDPKQSSRYPEVTPMVLALFALAFLLIAGGLSASIAAAVLVFFGSRDRYRILTGDDSSLRAWGIPLLTGILPAVFFAVMTLSALRSFLFSLAALRKGPGPEQAHLPPGSVLPGEPAYGGALTPEQEAQVVHLSGAGYTNRSANIAALQASDFDLREAETRLARSQVDLV